MQGSFWYTPKAIYQINERREVPISTEVAVSAASTRMTHLQRDSELNSPRSRDETSSPCTGFFRAVIQALELDVQLEGGSGILRALSDYYDNDYAA